MNPQPRFHGTVHDSHEGCITSMPGHELSVIRERLANATPSRWDDAIVVGVSADGWIDIELFVDGSSVSLWNHVDLSGRVAIGDPIAVHAVYDVLAVGGTKHSVLRLAN